MGRGLLQINLFVGENALPVKYAKVLIKNTDGVIIYNLATDENGLTQEVSLDAPDKKYSLDPYSKDISFGCYDVEIPFYSEYKKIIVHNVEVFDSITSTLPIQMHPSINGDSAEENTEDIYIPLAHGVNNPDGNERFLDYNDNLGNINSLQVPQANEVRVPEYITVHLGSPNAAAPNVRVPFIDYVKNVASSEIFPTWNEAALYANIYAQISFVLNRVYTVWYRSRGFDFDMTRFIKNLSVGKG